MRHRLTPLRAIRTINSILDSSPKDIRKKLCHSDDHIGLLEDLAKALIDIGDYEMQVAISEALCRMTPKKMREDFAGKWFSFRSFASAFTSICDKDFETDCRTFLNELNSYFGNSRRVFSFPCIRVFLDSTELFKPEDESLKEFWVDFNIGTSTISFFVNDPQNTLWELIHLPKNAIKLYDLQEHDDHKILTIHMIIPVCHGEITGKIVQIIFGLEHNIQTALTRVFEEKPQTAPDSKDCVQLEEDLTMIEGTQHGQTEMPQTFTSSPAEETKDISKVPFHLSGPSRYPRPKVKGSPGEDIFYLKDHSDSEVVLAKTMLFCQKPSSNGSTKSLPDTLSKTSVKKRTRVLRSDEGFLRRETPCIDYSRRKPRAKSKFRVLPLSSPSSNEEFSKFSTPKHRLHERERRKSDEWQPQVKLLRTLNVESSLFTSDSGFQDKTVVSETSLPVEEPDNLIEEEPSLDKEASPPLQRSEPLESSEQVSLKIDQQKLPKHLTIKPRKLCLSSSLEDTAEQVTQTLLEEEESEEDLGSGVRAAFNSFKTQLRAHFSSRYKKIEARSLQSLTDCQRNVTSLLGTVHNQRLVHLEQFQNSVVQQLACLEQDCLSLKTIERETVNFWQSESNTVRAFCDRQQKRLDSLRLPRKSTDTSLGLLESSEAKISVPADIVTSQSSAEHSSMGDPSETTTADPS